MDWYELFARPRRCLDVLRVVELPDEDVMFNSEQIRIEGASYAISYINFACQTTSSGRSRLLAGDIDFAWDNKGVSYHGKAERRKVNDQYHWTIFFLNKPMRG